MRLFLAAVIVSALACGRSTQQVGPAPGPLSNAGGPVDDGEPPLLGPGCPGTFAEARALRVDCADGDREIIGCGYDDGVCTCGRQQQCGGMRRAALPATWTCTPSPPPVRADGCPGVQPRAGTPCAAPGKDCAYGRCTGVQLRCARGKWTPMKGHAPPP